MRVEEWLSADEVAESRANWALVEDLGERYRNDASVRAKIDSGDVPGELDEFVAMLPPGMEVRVVADTPDTHHFVLPPDPNMDLADEALSQVAGGKSASSASSAGTASTFACATFTSSMSSAGSAGTAASAS